MCKIAHALCERHRLASACLAPAERSLQPNVQARTPP